MSSTPPIDAKLDVLTEAVLFLVRHGAARNLSNAFVADLHRAFVGDKIRRAVVDDLAERLRAQDTFVAENDA